jgi:hypothetical protein
LRGHSKGLWSAGKTLVDSYRRVMPVEGLDLIHSPAFIWGRDVLHRRTHPLLKVVVCVVCRGRCYMVAAPKILFPLPALKKRASNKVTICVSSPLSHTRSVECLRALIAGRADGPAGLPETERGLRNLVEKKEHRVIYEDLSRPVCEPAGRPGRSRQSGASAGHQPHHAPPQGAAAGVCLAADPAQCSRGAGAQGCDQGPWPATTRERFRH